MFRAGKMIIINLNVALIILRQQGELSPKIMIWHSFWVIFSVPISVKILFMKTIHPLRQLLTSILAPRKHRHHGYRAKIRASILKREESLNRIFMVRYKMGNM
jgi:hypothetical protein